MMKKNNKSGFTLLELLVVIGIIALLVSIATVSYNTAQVRTRDTRRKADLNSMRDALEQYYAANNLVYPASCSSASTFIKGTWPVDPGTYTYTEDCAATTSYCICAQMEAGNGGNATTNACGWGSGAYYCVGSLQ